MIIVNEVSICIHQRTGVVGRLQDPDPRGKRLAECCARNRLAAWDTRHENGGAFGIPCSYACNVPSANGLIQNFISEAVAVAHELTSSTERKLVGVIQQPGLRQFIPRHTVSLHQIMRVLQQSTPSWATVLNVFTPAVSQRFANAIRSQQGQTMIATALDLQVEKI